MLLLRPCYSWCGIVFPALLCGVYYMCYIVQYGPALMALAENCKFPCVAVFASSRCFTLQPTLMKNNSTASKYIQTQKERGVVCCSIRGCYLLKSYDSQGMIDFTLNPTTDLFFVLPLLPSILANSFSMGTHYSPDPVLMH